MKPGVCGLCEFGGMPPKLFGMGAASDFIVLSAEART